MKKLCIRHYFTAIAIGMSLVFSQSNASCAREGEWNIQLEPMYISTNGNDTSIADKVTYTQAFVDGRLDQIQTRSPFIDLTMDDGFALRGALEYKKNLWGIGISGWWLDARGEASLGPFKSGSIAPLPGQGMPSFIKIVLWGEVLTPPSIEMDEGLSLEAQNDLGVWSTDVYGIRTLVQNPEGQFGLTFGAKIGDLDNDRNESVANAFFMIPVPPWVTIYARGSARQKSRAMYDLMAGPSLGLYGQAKSGRHCLGFFLTQAVLLGKIKQEASFQVETLVPPLSTQRFSKKNSETLPITEVKMKYSYRATDHLSLGLGMFASIWWNVSLAPEFSHASTFSSNPDSWHSRENNLNFLGATASLGYEF